MQDVTPGDENGAGGVIEELGMFRSLVFDLDDGIALHPSIRRWFGLRIRFSRWPPFARDVWPVIAARKTEIIRVLVLEAGVSWPYPKLPLPYPGIRLWSPFAGLEPGREEELRDLTWYGSHRGWSTSATLNRRFWTSWWCHSSNASAPAK